LRMQKRAALNILLALCFLSLCANVALAESGLQSVNDFLKNIPFDINLVIISSLIILVISVIITLLLLKYDAVTGSINRKLIIGLIISSFIPLIILSLLFFFTTRGIIETKEHGKVTSMNSLEILADSYFNSIDTFFREKKGLAMVFSKNPSIRKIFHVIMKMDPETFKEDPAFINMTEELDRLFPGYDSNASDINILFIDIEGIIRYASKHSEKSSIGGKINITKEELAESDESGRVITLFSQNNKEDSVKFVITFHETEESTEKKVGYILFEGTVHELLRGIPHSFLGETGEIVLSKMMKSHYEKVIEGHSTSLRKDHLLILSTASNNLTAQRSTPSMEEIEIGSPLVIPLQEAVQKRSGSGISTDYRGNKVYAVWRYIPSADWGIVVKIDSSELTAPTTKMALIFMLFFASSISGIVYYSFFMARSITEPIDKMTRFTRDISRGVFSSRMTIKTGDEMIELSKGFNSMAEALERIDEERRKLDRAKTEFLSITSHELRSPMTPIKAQMQMLLKGYYGRLSQRQKETIEMILNNTNRLDKIIADLLEVSRIEAGRIKFSFVRTNMKEEVVKLAEEARTFMAEKGIVIRLKMETLPIVEVDPDRVMQVLRNLLNNAIKFSKKGGEIIVTVVPIEGAVQFSVKDTGIGISRTDLNRIFEPFYQSEHTIYREYGGTGLGLTICKGIIESQKGKIWAESEPGKGSTFFFTVPFNPVKDILPLRLMFSSKGLIDEELMRVFKVSLGPIGIDEFNALKNNGSLTEEGLHTYFESLNKKNIISADESEILKRKIKKIFIAEYSEKSKPESEIPEEKRQNLVKEINKFFGEVE